MVICLERGADLHMAQWIPLPLTVSCSSKIQIGFTFLVPAHPGSPGQRAVKQVCVCNRIVVVFVFRLNVTHSVVKHHNFSDQIFLHLRLDFNCFLNFCHMQSWLDIF